MILRIQYLKRTTTFLNKPFSLEGNCWLGSWAGGGMIAQNYKKKVEDRNWIIFRDNFILFDFFKFQLEKNRKEFKEKNEILKWKNK